MLTVAAGDAVEAGDRLATIEAMKMEATITALLTGPSPGSCRCGPATKPV